MIPIDLVQNYCKKKQYTLEYCNEYGASIIVNEVNTLVIYYLDDCEDYNDRDTIFFRLISNKGVEEIEYLANSEDDNLSFNFTEVEFDNMICRLLNTTAG
jgi:hypothetical protein